MITKCTARFSNNTIAEKIPQKARLCKRKKARSPLTGYETARQPKPTPHFDYCVCMWCVPQKWSSCATEKGLSVYSAIFRQSLRPNQIAADICSDLQMRCRCMQRFWFNRDREVQEIAAAAWKSQQHSFYIRLFYDRSSDLSAAAILPANHKMSRENTTKKVAP